MFGIKLGRACSDFFLAVHAAPKNSKQMWNMEEQTLNLNRQNRTGANARKQSHQMERIMSNAENFYSFRKSTFYLVLLLAGVEGLNFPPKSILLVRTVLLLEEPLVPKAFDRACLRKRLTEAAADTIACHGEDHHLTPPNEIDTRRHGNVQRTL
eukprot:5792711-Amphidinium_carterae.1